MKVAVSYLSSTDKKECIKLIDKSNADYIHVDLCDGKYVKEKNFTMSEVKNLLKNAIKPLDVHLMVKNPMKYIDEIAMLNVETIIIHIDIENTMQTLEYIQSMGLKAGLAINPNQSIKLLEPYLNIIDRILFMSVKPGKGGQAFMPSIIGKIDKINLVKDKYHFETSVDGGINDETINHLKDKNIDIIISGSYITNSIDYNEAIDKLYI